LGSLRKIELVNLVSAQRQESWQLLGVVVSQKTRETLFSNYVKAGHGGEAVAPWWRKVNSFPLYSPEVSEPCEFHGAFAEMKILMSEWEQTNMTKEEICIEVDRKLRKWRSLGRLVE